MREYIYNLTTDKYKGLIPDIIKLCLFILSLIYGLAIRILILFNRLITRKLNAKVVSVGNITLGGTGKTSLVEFIAECLKLRNHKVAILSRGYKGRGVKAPADEPFMLQMNLKDVPVIVNADRIKGGSRAINDFSADTLILDDGFQQWKIKKDLEIVTIDATNPFGNKHMIPRGILREPLSSLKRADMFVLTKTNLQSDTKDLKNILSRINPSAEIFESMHKPIGFYSINKRQELLNLDRLKDKTATLFCGIADPDSFERLITESGIKIGLSFKFPDHYNYTQRDLGDISQRSKDKGIDMIITTEKDAARLHSLQPSAFSLQLLVFRISIAIKDEQRFHNRLLKLYSL
jgi:tetraacyldisaccharide 4'-kinase